MNTDPLTVEELEGLSPEDGFDDDTGCECCPVCDVIYSANGGYTGPVWDLTGERYDTRHDSDPEEGPFLCSECKTRAARAMSEAENKSLTDFTSP